jgi:LysM repeat protein
MPEFIANMREHEASRKKTVAVAKAATAPATTKKPAKSSTTRTASTSNKTYVVKKGDTLYSISRKFSTSIESLRKINGLNHNHIVPGQRLFVSAR